MIEKKYLSANSYLHDIWRLAAKVRSGGFRPDVLIALWRGGAPVGVAVHEFLKASGWDVRHAVIKCASYTGINENDSDVVFEYSQELLSSIKADEKVLVVDDVFDTGKTALAIKSLLESRSLEMRIASVYYKPLKNKTDISPDYFAREFSDEWIVFPHEICELSSEEIAIKDPVLFELLSACKQG